MIRPTQGNTSSPGHPQYPRRRGDAAGVDVGLQVIHGQSGLSIARHRALAATSPTSSEPASPGVLATATASMSASVRLARWSVSWITGKMRSRCAREAISGTTPPNLLVQVVLRGHHRRLDFEPIRNDRRRRFVAGGFDREEVHGELNLELGA